MAHAPQARALARLLPLGEGERAARELLRLLEMREVAGAFDGLEARAGDHARQ